MKSGMVSGRGGSFSNSARVSFSKVREESPLFFIFSVVV